MNIYYHHVGKKGATEDFPKTVYTPINISVVEQSIPNSVTQKETILRDLNSSFPEGLFNCWGVPSGAHTVIKNLAIGDFVLLIETTSGIGNIPALCHIKNYWNLELRDLSQSLWSNHKYPYIFFFNTERITLPWTHFIDHVGYKSNYRPSGNFLSVKQERLSKFGGESNYINFLKKKYGQMSNILKDEQENYSVQFDDFVHTSMPDVIDDINNQKASLEILSKTEQESIIKSRIGQGKFRKKLIDYWQSCAVTGCPTISILRASHIKPWRDCSNQERLDPYNGLLLIPNLDILFDSGLISFLDDGLLIVSSHLNEESQLILGLNVGLRIKRLKSKHKPFLDYHRNHVFKI